MFHCECHDELPVVREELSEAEATIRELRAEVSQLRGALEFCQSTNEGLRAIRNRLEARLGDVPAS